MPMTDSFGMAFYYYNKYVEDAKRKGETPLSMMQLMFGRK